MTAITNAEITTKSVVDTPGTGLFDTIMLASDTYLAEEFAEGRITGAEYATVYLAAMQSNLQQTIQFLLQKQEADKKAELLDAQINQTNEETDLTIAKTALIYEQIKASQAKTIRENLLNNSTLEKIVEEIDLLQSQDLEELAATARKDLESDAKIADINHSIAIKSQQEYGLEEKNGDSVTTYTYYTDGVALPTTTTTNLGLVVGPVLGSNTVAGAGASVVSLEKDVLISKDALIAAQTLGFKSDTKQKLLKVMTEGFTSAHALAGSANIPEAHQDLAIDALVDEILDDVGSSVGIGTETVLTD